MTLQASDFALIDTTRPITRASKPVKGAYGFVFEFKLREGNLFFIRYQDGEREFAGRKETIPVWLYSTPEAIKRAIQHHLRPFTGSNERVIKAAISMCISGEES